MLENVKPRPMSAAGNPARVPERRRRRASGVNKTGCPKCGNPTSCVVRSRGPYATRLDDTPIHRVRVCAECAEHYPTRETLDEDAYTPRTSNPYARAVWPSAASCVAIRGSAPIRSRQINALARWGPSPLSPLPASITSCRSGKAEHRPRHLAMGMFCRHESFQPNPQKSYAGNRHPCP